MRRKGRHREEEEEKLDRYLITYADLITLLLGLFVILYASSQVDADKFREVSSAIQDYFRRSDTVSVSGGKGVLPGGLGMLPGNIGSEGATFEQFTEKMEQEFGDLLTKGDIEVIQKGDELTLRLSEKLLFAIGKADVEAGARPLLDTIAGLLQGSAFSIRVEGHTDSIPIRTFQFESNWHLSVARSLQVGYILLQKGVPSANVELVGKGAEKPIATNATDEGRAANRRVEIILNKPMPTQPTLDGYIPDTVKTREM